MKAKERRQNELLKKGIISYDFAKIKKEETKKELFVANVPDSELHIQGKQIEKKSKVDIENDERKSIMNWLVVFQEQAKLGTLDKVTFIKLVKDKVKDINSENNITWFNKKVNEILNDLDVALAA